jgi:hypothetical protein
MIDQDFVAFLVMFYIRYLFSAEVNTMFLALKCVVSCDSLCEVLSLAKPLNVRVTTYN